MTNDLFAFAISWLLLISEDPVGKVYILVEDRDAEKGFNDVASA